MIIPIELRFKADKDSKSAFRTEKTIKSHDVNSVEFHISIDGLELTDNHTAKILSVFHSSKSQVNVDCEIVEGKIIYKPDTNLISRYEHVTNYVYVYHNNQSLDVCEFIYIVDLSKIDETSLEVKEVYDQSYADLLADFEQALSDYKDNLPQADSVRADIDEILNQFSEDSQAKLTQYDTDAQRVITDNQTAFDLAESVRQDSYGQAEDNRNQASNQAVTDWEQGADAIINIVEANESARVDTEANRKTAETDRVSSESTRKTNETNRISNEDARNSAEFIRLASEAGRVNAEIVRSEFYDVFDGRLDGLEADKVVLKNLIENGDFLINELSSNFIINSSIQESFTINDGKLVLKPKLFAWNNYIKIDFPQNIGDKIYCRFTIESPIATSVDWRVGGVSKPISYGPGESTISFVNTVNAINGYMYLYTQYFTPSMLIKLDKVKTINLTTTFGAGNEPTKSEIDELIKITGYFDEITLTQKQILTWQLKLMRQNRNALIALGGTII